jgi:hypothetical protein
MPKKFQLDVTDDYRWVETDRPFGQLQFTDIAGDEYYGATKTYRIALIGRGSAVAYYLTAVAPRETGKDESEAIALHKSMVIFGRVDPWSTAVRGDGYINHEDHLVGHWGTTVARYSAEYLRRDAFVRQNAAAFARAEHLGAELADEDVIMVIKRGELYQIYTKGNRSYFAAFVVAAMGLGPHRGLNTGPGTPQLPKGQSPRESQAMQRRLAPIVMDLDRFMREFPERGGIELRTDKRLTADPKLTILVHGANAGIDAVQRAWQLGYRVKWLCPGEPIFLKGNRLPVADDRVEDVKRYMLKARTEVVVCPLEDGKVQVDWTDDDGAGTASVDIYVIAVGQDPYAEGAVGDVLFKRGNLGEAGLFMIWDFDQVFGLPFQTILGYQVPGRRKGFGLQIIGASCEVLTRELGKIFDNAKLLDDFKAQLTPLEIEPTREHCDEQIRASESLTRKWGSVQGSQEYYEQKLANWRRACAQRVRFEQLAASYLAGLKGDRGPLMELLMHQVNPTKVPVNLTTLLQPFQDDSTLVGQLATPEWPATTAGASTLLPSQLGSVRAVIAALTSFIPEYILRDDSNFTTDDRNMLAVYIAQNFQGFTEIEANARVSATMSLRRRDDTPLGFHNDELRHTIQERWKRESGGE